MKLSSIPKGMKLADASACAVGKAACAAAMTELGQASYDQVQSMAAGFLAEYLTSLDRVGGTAYAMHARDGLVKALQNPIVVCGNPN